MTVLTRGIDVSEHNGHLKWEVIRPQIDFAILRAGFGQNLTSQDDSTFEYNASECARLGIPFGAYLFSYATNTDRAKSEAAHMLRLMAGKKFSYPIYYDLEDEATLGKQTNAQIAAIAETFCGALENAGHYVGVYANKYWFETKLTSAVFNKWTRWVAEYASALTYKGPAGMWQHTDGGKLNGCSGNFDKNECYIDYPGIIVPGGFNGNEKNGGGEFILGDVDGDGKVTAADARIALRASSRLETLTKEQVKRADMDGDGTVTAADARAILRKSANLD